ncbi:hypothetical protein DEJ17_06290 [Curtobacterium sp. MCSS17_011]|nr:hypothetical protein DEJ17_06290 [Curtobacterium sp. MCSS17_011]
MPTTDEPMDVFQAEAQRARAVQSSLHPPTREQINSAVGSVLFNASNYPRPAVPHILGADIGPLRNKVTDAVLALIQNGADRG